MLPHNTWSFCGGNRNLSVFGTWVETVTSVLEKSFVEKFPPIDLSWMTQIISIISFIFEPNNAALDEKRVEKTCWIEVSLWKHLKCNPSIDRLFAKHWPVRPPTALLDMTLRSPEIDTVWENRADVNCSWKSRSEATKRYRWKLWSNDLMLAISSHALSLIVRSEF